MIEMGLLRIGGRELGEEGMDAPVAIVGGEMALGLLALDTWRRLARVSGEVEGSEEGLLDAVAVEAEGSAEGVDAGVGAGGGEMRLASGLGDGEAMLDGEGEVVGETAFDLLAVDIEASDWR